MKIESPTYIEREVKLDMDGIEWPCVLDVGIGKGTCWLINIQAPDCTAEQHRKLWDKALEWIDEAWDELLESAQV